VGLALQVHALRRDLQALRRIEVCVCVCVCFILQKSSDNMFLVLVHRRDEEWWVRRIDETMTPCAVLCMYWIYGEVVPHSSLCYSATHFFCSKFRVHFDHRSSMQRAFLSLWFFSSPFGTLSFLSVCDVDGR